MRHLQTHLQRSHPVEVVSKASRPTANEYVAHAVDGMPECRHCRRVFTRVEALKKHLQGSCPVLHQRVTSDVEQPLVADVPLTVQNSPEHGLLGHSCRAQPSGGGANLAIVPLSAQKEFRALLQEGWKRVLRNAEFCANLRTYCVLCGQWVSVSGIKQHVRLMHSDACLHKAEAVARCTGFGLRVESPCGYCCLAVKDPKTHIRRCAVLFQASLCALVIAQEHDGGPRKSGGHDGTEGDARGEQTQEPTIDIPTQRLITEMVKLTIRHEEELPRHGQWQHHPAGTTGGGGLEPAVRGGESDHSPKGRPSDADLQGAGGPHCQAAKQYGWLEGEMKDADPSWIFFQWNPAQQCQEKSSLPALRQSEIRQHIDVLMLSLTTWMPSRQHCRRALNAPFLPLWPQKRQPRRRSAWPKTSCLLGKDPYGLLFDRSFLNCSSSLRRGRLMIPNCVTGSVPMGTGRSSGYIRKPASMRPHACFSMLL